MLLIPNQIICSRIGISSWFGISTAGINTRVIRATPRYTPWAGQLITKGILNKTTGPRGRPCRQAARGSDSKESTLKDGGKKRQINSF